MGRPKKYNTDEERHEADKADKRRWYHRNKDIKRNIFRLRSLRNYYKNKLNVTTDENKRNVIIDKIDYQILYNDVSNFIGTLINKNFVEAQ